MTEITIEIRKGGEVVRESDEKENVLTTEEIEKKCEAYLEERSFAKARLLVRKVFDEDTKFKGNKGDYSKLSSRKVGRVLSDSDTFIQIRESSTGITWGLKRKWKERLGSNNSIRE